MKNLLFLTLLFCSSLYLEGQYNNNYYTTDSSYHLVGEIIDGGEIENSRICKVMKGRKILKLSPQDISGYGFSDGRNYISASVRIYSKPEKVFLHEIIKDTVSLYSFKDRNAKYFFIKTEGSDYTYLTKNTDTPEEKDYLDILKELPEHCSENAEFPGDHLKYRDSHLRAYIENYNNCGKRPLNFPDYGFYTALNISSLVPNWNNETEFSESIVKQSDYSLALGVYANFPINQSNFNFHPEIYFQKSDFQQYTSGDAYDIDYIINRSTLSIPLLFNYKIQCQKISYFISGGPTFQYSYVNESDIYLTSSLNQISEFELEFPGSKRIITTTKPNTTPIIDSKQIGFSTGVGLEYKLNCDINLVLEARYTESARFYNKGMASINGFQLITGISFK